MAGCFPVIEYHGTSSVSLPYKCSLFVADTFESGSYFMASYSLSAVSTVSPDNTTLFSSSQTYN